MQKYSLLGKVENAIFLQTRKKNTTAPWWSKTVKLVPEVAPYYWENLVLVVFLVSESKALFILTAKTGNEDNNGRLPEQIADLIISNFSCRALKSVAWITGKPSPAILWRTPKFTLPIPTAIE